MLFRVINRFLPSGSAGIVRGERTLINPQVIENMVDLCRLELQMALGEVAAPYRCDTAVVYRLAGAAADHYFFINDGEAQEARLDTQAYRYRAVSDAVSGERLVLNQPIALERYGGRWLRFEK